MATSIELCCQYLFPEVWWSAAIAAGISISAMAALRVTHPPAGADPLVVFAIDPYFGLLLSPVAIGSASFDLISITYHRFTDADYPLNAR